jgi:hypothetical protein
MITWEDYFQRMVNLKAEFYVATAAIAGWADSQEALDKYSTEQLEDLRTMFREHGGHDDAWVFTDEQRIASYLDAVKADAPQKLPALSSRLAQHEYILQVTIFESFIKSIHRAILRAHPSLLKHDRTIELGRLVAQGKEEIIDVEIEREIQILDRKDVKEKDKYFRNRLGINWLDGTAGPLLADAIDLRNIMLHEDPNREVTPNDTLILVTSTSSVSFATVAGAAILYPTVCALPTNLSQESAQKFVSAARKENPKSHIGDAGTD